VIIYHSTFIIPRSYHFQKANPAVTSFKKETGGDFFFDSVTIPLENKNPGPDGSGKLE
jgi:hypothetical protein